MAVNLDFPFHTEHAPFITYSFRTFPSSKSMKTITIYLEGEQDAIQIMKALDTMPFKETVEVYQMDEDISHRKLEAFEERFDAYHKKPYTKDGYISFKNDVKERYNVDVLIKLK